MYINSLECLFLYLFIYLHEEFKNIPSKCYREPFFVYCSILDVLDYVLEVLIAVDIQQKYLVPKKIHFGNDPIKLILNTYI